MTVFSLAVTILRSFDWSFYCSKVNFFSGFQFLGQSLREMEDFRGIADESFPSFLTNSLLGGNSEILENVTLSSNLGLPVAVSTLARNRSSTDNRNSDVQASYLVEGKYSIPSESSPSSQSEAEPRERLQLVFPDDDSISKKKNQTEGRHLSGAVLKESAFQSDRERTEEEHVRAAKPFQSQDPSDGISPLEQERDLPIDSCSRSWMNKENKVVVPGAGKHFEERNPNNDLSHTSFLENEKLMSPASWENSSDDDIDDEEFYDDHLEAYFEQLAIPGMMYEGLEGQESPENYFKLPASDPSQERGREEGLVKTLRAANAKLNPVYFHDTNASKGDFGLIDPLKLDAGSPHQNKHLTSDSETVLPVDRFLDTEMPQVSIQKNVDVASLKSVSDNAFNSADALWSPTSERRTCECYESVGKSKDQTDLSQSVVYQNEEGRWVTDLAYYTAFDKEQDVNVSLSDEMNEGFRSGSDALDLIAQDEEEFNKEHQFMQEENIDAQNTSAALGDTSWGTSVNYGLLRRSLSTSDLDKDDATYLRLSLGEFFAQRSEALGCLGGGYNVRRPSFGYFIRSPEKREPIALIRKSDVSRSNLEKEMAHLNHGLFSGDLKAQLSEGSVTLQAEELESISQVDENDVTLTANKGKTEDTFLINSKPQRRTGELPSSGDSVLRISTIASAIADASVNTDPSQLAAMIKALSNKTREKTSQDDDLKNPSPECGGHGSEDDQDSFRPSTSPLSHSSPSEISGNNLSGCALESFNSAAHLQKHPCERESSQLTCPQASISRLTYMSEQESTCPATASDRGLKDHQSDVTSALSTTIIQASPVPSQERAPDKLREKSPFQSRGKGALPYIIQKNLDTEKETETTSQSSELEDVKPNFRSRRELSSKSEDLSETTVAGVTSDPSELDQISLALPRELGLGQWALPATPRLPVSRQGPVPDSGRVTPVDTSAADSAFVGQGPPQTSFPSTEGCGPAPSRQHVPTSGPALSARRPLPMAPCAQLSSGALPRCQAGGATACGLPGSCHPAVVTGEHVQNSVAMGLCLGQNISSGLMAASSLCNPYSNAFNQSLLSTAKPFSVQSLGPNCGIDPWDSGVTSGFGKVRVPEELKFPHACCIGIASQTYLSVLNPADRWLQVSIGVLSVSVNGEKVDLSAYPCLVFKNKVIIRPHATEEIKVLFIPSDPGIFRCIFSIASWPFSADAETVAQAEALASRVVLTAIAETPVIEVETEKKDVLDFGDLTYGSWKALPLKLVNKTHANIPIRLIINANAIAWRCFTFSKEPIHAALKAVPYAHAIAQLAAPSVINHMMPASDDGQDPEFLIIWVLFHSPKKRMTSSEILDSAEEFLARVDIEVDSPNPTPVIKSISLRARTGIARIHAPKDLQTMHLFASVASSTRQYLPLKNAGNIDVHLDIKIPDQGSHFSVDPEKLFLKPGEEHEVIVSFSPKDPKACEERILKIFVQSFGPQYEVMLKGEVVSSGNKPLMPASCCSDIPSILSNKQFLAWGGVPLGRTQLQKLALRNNSTSSAQHLRLLIRGQDQDCFQFQHTFGSEERLTSNCEVRIHPKEDIYISVLFAPTRLSCMLAKLEIKQLGIRSQPGFKFTIPLSGYGGTSNLILEDVKKLSDSYMVTVNDLVPGKESRIVFSVRNTGSRAAFVKAVGFKDSQKKVLLNPRVLRIFPDKFVLKERTQEDVTIIYNPSDRENNCKNTTELSTIYFFGGDEISRQQYRRAMLHTPGVREQVLPTQSMLQNINFTEAFQDELLVTEVYDLPQRPNDVQLFYGNMRKIILSVIGEFRDSVSNREFLPPSSRPSLESKSESGSCGTHGGNISLDVLPVKGPQGSPLLSQAVRPPQDKSASEEVWAVQPERLILVAPSCDMAKTGRFQILNNSVRLLKFELYWPAHCLTVTPQHGFIAPESKLQILVSPNSSLSTKHSVFPWSGLIYIHCDNGQKKIVKVQIREDLTQEELFTCLTSSPFGILSPETEPSVNHLVKPVTKPPSTRVEIRNKTVTFPTTEPGETSGSYLELENHGDTEVRWHLSSLAPPYVKGVDESGDVFRATYAAFRCSPISGVLESHGVQKVSITFLPRDRGDYAQFWDVECHPLKEPHLKHTLRFQLSGHSVKAEHELENSRISRNSLIKIDNLLKPRRQAVSEASALIPGRQLDLTHRGVYAPEDVYRFLPTRVGESRTLKVNLRNNSFITHLLKFLSPREPFYVKHSKYSLRAQHYINMPVQFKPRSVGKFEALLVVQTDEGKSVAVRLIGEALGKS
ncbi:centrosomal protein of 192 kDa isoform X4 [Balaenoptera acutorostrata]|uniref:Centrosomal protein of 192 kDa isoform X4 n=1 Tax=Balaenoptera acutorostrata TaxID=9767 RepID=A0ABM3RZU9_BALAC|nr:centrosomal protein of 192 kDa isoform X4 [Balaenoptera acutorostrata]